jgi:mannonate dehydratase
MMLCLGPAAVGSHAPTRIEFCRATGVPAVLEPCGSVPGFADTQRLDVRRLRAYRQPFADAGIEIVAMNAAPLYPSTIGGGSATETALDVLRGVFEALGEVGVPAFTQTLRLPKLPEPAGDEQMQRLYDYYRRLCGLAESAGVRIATHSPWSPETNGWMWGASHFARLFEAVPSRANGFLYDNAILSMLGDDPAEAVRRFGDRIAFCHIRDVRRAADGVGVAGTGYDEVFPGDGEIDFRAIFAALSEVGYRGGLMPEHLPRLPNDPTSNAAIACAIGYFKALLEERKR